MAKRKEITKEQYDADLNAANKKQVITMEDANKNKVINFMSFYNFQLDVIKSNLVMPLNNIDKIEIKKQWNDDNDHIKPLLDTLTNLGQEVINLLNEYIEWNKK